MEGQWLATPATHTPYPGDGGLWWHWFRSMPGLDVSLQRLLPLLSGQREHLWCQWGAMTRPKWERGCTLIFPLVHSNKPIFFVFYYSMSSMHCLFLFMPNKKNIPLAFVCIFIPEFAYIADIFVKMHVLVSIMINFNFFSAVPCTVKMQKPS